MFQYPEVVHTHFKNPHAVNDHNGKRHSPISLEVEWATNGDLIMSLIFYFLSQRQTLSWLNPTSQAGNLTA